MLEDRQSRGLISDPKQNTSDALQEQASVLLVPTAFSPLQ